MDCEKANELLPWYLNGSLSGDERRQVDEHLRTCESCRLELEGTSLAGAVFAQHLPEEVLVDFGFGRTPEGYDASNIEEHLAVCERCAGELEMVRESFARPAEPVAAPLPFPTRGTATSQPPRKTTGPWRWLALAATLAAVAASSGWLWSLAELRRLGDRLAELESPQADVRVLELYPAEPVLRSDDPPPDPVQIPSGTAAVTLLLVPGEAASSAVHDLELIGPGGASLWLREDVEHQPEGDFAVTLRIDTLVPGTYTLRLFARARAGDERRAVADYPIVIAP